MKKFFVVLFGMGSVFTANAQQCDNAEDCHFRHGWYVGASSGVNLYVAEGNEFWNTHEGYVFSLKDNGGPMGRVGVGYDFTPVIGLNGSIAYLQHHWPDVRKPNPDGSPKAVIFNAGNITLDLMVNLSNWWAGYNSCRFINITIFGGFGGAYRGKDNFPSDLFSGIVRGGGQADIRLSHSLNANLAIQGNIVRDDFNGYINDTPYELQASLMAGITYHFR
jgi:hypothetical protein